MSQKSTYDDLWLQISPLFQNLAGHIYDLLFLCLNDLDLLGEFGFYSGKKENVYLNRSIGIKYDSIYNERVPCQISFFWLWK